MLVQCPDSMVVVAGEEVEEGKVEEVEEEGEAEEGEVEEVEEEGEVEVEEVEGKVEEGEVEGRRWRRER